MPFSSARQRRAANMGTLERRSSVVYLRKDILCAPI